MSEEQKKEILGKSIDADQLDQVTGGTAIACKLPECANISKRDDCKATVELGSWCGSNDACYVSDCDYDGCTKADTDERK